ncbi:MAG: hypothetical protein A2474_05855 [Elusimicrobia bacterium RIFOXYC2_FULL_34_12]|nr:MAG: hypothetical protein A2474_05855 [Elusimicrobia bacterium RIFOXYC2_FULL_34_12]OGS39001.1 MAG: hypothetical protein A2551_04675 [Elusimicrobia bacterium RIFOXYD2_FULL_34_30]
MEQKNSILLVDDDVSVLESVKEILKQEYNIMTVTTGEEAIEIIKREPQDLVILDVNLNGISGIETLEIIRSIERDLPVIMLSGMNTIKTVIKSIKLGANNFIDKPFNINDLRIAVNEAIDGNNKKAINKVPEVSIDVEQFAEKYVQNVMKDDMQLKNALKMFKEEYINFIFNKFRNKFEHTNTIIK